MTVLPRITSAPTLSKRFDLCCLRNWYQAKGRNLVALIFFAQIAALQLIGAANAWAGELYPIDRKGVVERSDIILQKPNVSPSEAMPLGNGRLGVAVWAQDGFTAQLNRGDTFRNACRPAKSFFRLYQSSRKHRTTRAGSIFTPQSLNRVEGG